MLRTPFFALVSPVLFFIFKSTNTTGIKFHFQCIFNNFKALDDSFFVQIHMQQSHAGHTPYAQQGFLLAILFTS